MRVLTLDSALERVSAGVLDYTRPVALRTCEARRQQSSLLA